MPSKKRAKKGIESLGKQIELHRSKLEAAEKNGNIGFSHYYEKEIEHFGQAKEKLERRLIPRTKRKKMR